jgi:hypothetical protein
VNPSIEGSPQLVRQSLQFVAGRSPPGSEPHFLFNTLASIDPLIEVDPPFKGM